MAGIGRLPATFQILSPCKMAEIDGDVADVQALMHPSRQSVDEVKRVVSEARHKVQRPPTNINGTFNEEDFMDGDLVDEDMA